MHTLLIFLTGVLILSAVIVIICHVNDENLTPVGKTFSSLFIACCAVVMTIQVVIDHPGQAALSSIQEVGPVSFAGTEWQSPAPVAAPGVEPRAVATAPTGQTVTQVAAPTAVVQTVAQPERDSSTKDMMLGGLLGYALGSGGRGSDTHTVTNNTTVVHSTPSAPSAPSAPSPAYHQATPAPSAPSPAYRQATPAPRPVVAAAPPSPTFKSTFSMTRSGRR